MRPVVAVIGAGSADRPLLERARAVGEELGRRDLSLVTGGLGGVMEAASAGFLDGRREAGATGLAIGLLPGTDPGEGNPHLDVALPTGLGHGRNLLVVRAASALIAVGGRFGTLSELAFALVCEKPVVSLGSWEVDPAVLVAGTPAEAVELVRARL